MISDLPRQRLFGLDFVDVEDVELVAQVLLDHDAARPGLPHQIIVTPNVDHLVRLDRGADATANRVAAAATIVLPDGQPIIWASRILGRPLRARLPGSDLVASLFPRLVAEGKTVVVIATSDQVAERIEAEGDSIRALVAPQLSLDDRPAFDDFVDRCAALIAEERPTHVFVTLGFPKQCNVIGGVQDRLDPEDVPAMLAVGASFDMYYGIVRRAPEWVQRVGLEWFFRFAQEPRRLFRRYFVDDPAFVGIVWREWRRDRQESSERRRDRRRFDA